MKIRKTDANGDWVFGRGMANFFKDVPDAPALAVVYRLQMNQGEWFMDPTLGTPYQTQIIGFGTEGTRDVVLRYMIGQTQGVSNIVDYSSSLARDTRGFTVNCNINTVYSNSPIAVITSIGGR